MPRPSLARDGVGAIAIAIFLNIVLGLYFAADGRVDPRAPLPLYAIRPTTELLATLQSASTQPIPLIPVAFRKPDSDSLANTLLGLLVWLPATVGVLAALLQYHCVRSALLAAADDRSKRDGDLLNLAVRRAAIVTGLLFVIAITWAVLDNAFISLLLALLVLGMVLLISVRSEIPNRFVLIAALLFMVSGLAASITSHRLYTTYHGLVLVPFSDQEEEQRLLTDVQRDINLTPNLTANDVFDRIERLPSLGGWHSGMAIFAKNRVATRGVIISALIYLLAFSPGLQRLKSEYQMRTGFVIAYALVLYLAVGAAFGLLYFNEVLAEAGRQNVLCILAGGASAPEAEFDQLKVQFALFGWSEKLERAIEQIRRSTTRHSSEVVKAALAEHWSNSVIAQEQPQSIRAADGRLLPEAHLVTNQTLADMFYFSFASFTTTGYGDIRPVSDSARLWSIIENIAELLFTAIFFVVALAEAKADEEPPNSAATPVTTTINDTTKALTVVACLSAVFLSRCTTIREQPIDASELRGTPEALCPAPMPPDDVQVHVIIDDSLSMRGYFRAQGSDYPTILNSLLNTLQSTSRATFYRLSSPKTPIEMDASYNDTFYNRPSTPLAGAFRLVRNIDAKISIVLISDFVEPEHGGFQQLSRELTAAMKTRPFVALYGWKTPYRQNDTQLGDRPWYALLMSSSEEGLSLVERASGVQAASFRGTVESVSAARPAGPNIFRSRSFAQVASLEWVADQSSDLGWQPAVKDQPLHKCDKSEQAVQYSAYVRLAPDNGELRFRGALVTTIPLKDVGDIAVSVRRVDRDAHGNLVNDGVAPRNSSVRVLRYIQADPSPAVSRARRAQTASACGDSQVEERSEPAPPQSIPVEIVYSLPIDGEKTSYIVEFHPGRLNLSCPKWISDWSTRDRGTWCKTFNLQDIVQAIIEASSKTETFLIQRLVLARAGS